MDIVFHKNNEKFNPFIFLHKKSDPETGPLSKTIFDMKVIFNS